MKTKKLLIAFIPEGLEHNKKEFLLPVDIDGEYRFLGLSSGKLYEYGLVVMTGNYVTVNDVFKKLVELGNKIENVDETLNSIAMYFELVNGFKISNVIRIYTEISSKTGYGFEKTRHKISERKKMP